MLLGLYFVLVIALPLALGSLVVLNRMPRSRSCPACAGETIRLQSRGLAVASAPLRSEELHARWCATCGWEGAARLRRTVPVRQGPAVTATAEVDQGRGGVAIRNLDLNGTAWKVVLECWSADEGWKGRLRFEGAGHSWTDDDSPIEGGSALEVITRAMALPDGALAGRIRKATR